MKGGRERRGESEWVGKGRERDRGMDGEVCFNSMYRRGEGQIGR